MKLIVAAFALAAVCVVAAEDEFYSPYNLDGDTIIKFFHDDPQIMELLTTKPFTSSRLVKLRQHVIRKLQAWGLEWRENHAEESPMTQSKEYPYWGFIPQYVTRVFPTGAPAAFSSPCFKQNSVTLKPNANGTFNLEFNAQQPGLLCNDFYHFGSISSIRTLHVQAIQGAGVRKMLWTPLNPTDAEKWDIEKKGVRIFRFLEPPGDVINDIISTVFLFMSELTMQVPPEVAKANLEMMAKYRKVVMTERKTQIVTIDENLVQSGDFIGVIRLDGLDTMLAWAMGSTTSHTAVALRENGVLYVAESTTDSAYWPTNGIQRTPWKKWLEQSRNASESVVWAPLSAASRAKFNENAANAAFKSLEGLDYGFTTLLWGWIDTVKDNYPCLPPDFKTCLTYDLMEVLLGFLDKFFGLVGDALFHQAFNKRLGNTNFNRAADQFKFADDKGIGSSKLPTLPEQDAWDYNTTRFDKPAVGKSMVCCVFVCNIWKAAGLFKDIGDQIQCGEQTNWDIYVMNFFDTTTPRPPQCVAADPNNQLCQLEGKYTLNLNNFNTKKPYPKYGENCPGVAPDYKKPADC